MEQIPLTNHPSLLLKSEWVTIIRQSAENAEKQKQLSAEQLDLLYRNKWFLALAPSQYGGLQWSFPEIVAFEEAIGWADGSMGWVFTLCSGAGWFGGFLDANFAEQIFKDPKACLAGSGAATGTAIMQTDGSYLINGNWKYASGALHATIFTANCQIFENGKPVMENNEPKIEAFCFLREEVSIHNTWNEIGLIASAGHSFSVENLVVTNTRKFSPNPQNQVLLEPLYCLPFMDLAAATIAANYAGMTIHFLEEFASYSKTKKDRNGELLWEKESLQSTFQQAVLRLNESRHLLYKKVNEEWLTILESKNTTYNLFPESNLLVQNCREIINQLYPYGGLSIINPQTALSRVWRDFQTGSQHAMFTPA